MGWKGTLRSINAMSRQMEREAKRRQRELENQRKQFEKMQELDRANYEVQVYENYIDRLQSIHKECSEVCDWSQIIQLDPPIKPKKINEHETAAQAKVDNYKPGFSDKLFKKTESKINKLMLAVENAKKDDELEYTELLYKFEKDYADWKETVEISEGIINGDIGDYLKAINMINPFEEVKDLGSSIMYNITNKNQIDVTLCVNGERIIPQEIKSLLKSGKLSVKKMPKSKFYEIYQDHVCSCILRVSRELFALLPIEMVIVTAMSDILNTQTGHMEEKPIVSVAFPRKTIESINFDMIDPSDSMTNFVHRMNFKKTNGFEAVERLKFDELKLPM